MVTTGHKSETSIKSYARRSLENKRKQMSNTLVDTMKKKKKKPTSIMVKQQEKVPENTNNNNNNNNNEGAADPDKFQFETLEILNDQIVDILPKI